MMFNKQEIEESLEDAFVKFQTVDKSFSTQIFYMFEEAKDSVFLKFTKNTNKYILEEIAYQLDLLENYRDITKKEILEFEISWKEISEGRLFYDQEKEISNLESWYAGALKKDIQWRERNSHDSAYIESKMHKASKATELKALKERSDDLNKKYKAAGSKYILKEIKDIFFSIQEVEIWETKRQEEFAELVLKEKMILLNRKNDLSIFFKNKNINEYEINDDFSSLNEEFPNLSVTYMPVFLKKLIEEKKLELEKLKKSKDLKQSILKMKKENEVLDLKKGLKEAEEEINNYQEHFNILKNDAQEEIEKLYNSYSWLVENGHTNFNLSEEEKSFWKQGLIDRKKIIAKKQIEHIYHFSPLENLENILKYGILSISEVKKRNIFSIITDHRRLDKREDFICTSLSFPNSKLLRLKEYSHGDFLIFSISPEVLYENVAIFCPTNAAKYNEVFKPTKWFPFKMLTKNEDFERLFEKEEIREKNNLENKMPTDLQAEILIYKKIPLNKIKNIFCKNEEVFDKAIKTFSSLNLNDNDFIKLNPSLFERRKDQDFWENKNFYDFK